MSTARVIIAAVVLLCAPAPSLLNTSYTITADVEISPSGAEAVASALGHLLNGDRT